MRISFEIFKIHLPVSEHFKTVFSFKEKLWSKALCRTKEGSCSFNRVRRRDRGSRWSSSLRFKLTDGVSVA